MKVIKKLLMNLYIKLSIKFPFNNLLILIILYTKVLFLCIMGRLRNGPSNSIDTLGGNNVHNEF